MMSLQDSNIDGWKVAIQKMPTIEILVFEKQYFLSTHCHDQFIVLLTF